MSGITPEEYKLLSAEWEKLGGAISIRYEAPAGSDAATVKQVTDLNAKVLAKEAEHRAKKIVGWAEPIKGRSSYDALWADMTSKTEVERGDANALWKELVAVGTKAGIPAARFEPLPPTAPPPPPLPPAGTTPAAATTVLVPATTSSAVTTYADMGMKIDDGKVKVLVDINKFKTEVSVLLGKVQKADILKAVVKQSAESDFFALIVQMLAVDESYHLIGLLSARLLLPQDNRVALDGQLKGMTVLLNKQGTLSQGLVRLGGFIGLASVAGEPRLAQAVKFIKNPILGEDVEDREPRQKLTETPEAFKLRKEGHVRQFAQFKAIMTEMKAYKKPFDSLDAGIKAKLKAHVLDWTTLAT